jgi:hypothetical protein
MPSIYDFLALCSLILLPFPFFDRSEDSYVKALKYHNIFFISGCNQSIQKPLQSSQELNSNLTEVSNLSIEQSPMEKSFKAFCLGKEAEDGVINYFVSTKGSKENETISGVVKEEGIKINCQYKHPISSNYEIPKNYIGSAYDSLPFTVENKITIVPDKTKKVTIVQRRKCDGADYSNMRAEFSSMTILLEAGQKFTVVDYQDTSMTRKNREHRHCFYRYGF